jgi:riboflavin biosynthesis pyrimidine reductase
VAGNPRPRNDIRFEALTGAEEPPATEAERHYGGALRLPSRPKPYVFANFVSTLDGVASLGIHDGTDSSTISGSNTADRFLMGMLRAAADVVLIGAGTLRASVGHQWTPHAVAPDHDAVLSEYQRAMRRRQGAPVLAVVTGSGQLPSHVALTQPALEPIVLTSPDGVERVRAAFPHMRTLVVGTDRELKGRDIIDALHRELDAAVILTEGGPSLMGALLATKALHELFLTISPAIAGRDASHPRLALVNDFVAPPRQLETAALLSARRAGDHLFLRYRLRA